MTTERCEAVPLAWRVLLWASTSGFDYSLEDKYNHVGLAVKGKGGKAGEIVGEVGRGRTGGTKKRGRRMGFWLTVLATALGVLIAAAVFCLFCEGCSRWWPKRWIGGAERDDE